MAIAGRSLILKRAAASRPSGEWNDDDFDVLADGVVVGRIFKVHAAPVGSPWMWTLAFGHHEERQPTHGYATTPKLPWPPSQKVGGENNQEKAAPVNFSATGPSGVAFLA